MDASVPLDKKTYFKNKKHRGTIPANSANLSTNPKTRPLTFIHSLSTKLVLSLSNQNKKSPYKIKINRF